MAAAGCSGAEQKRKPRGKPFPKGVSGNPGGKSLAVAEAERLASEIKSTHGSAIDPYRGKPRRECALDELYERGMGGRDTAALKEYIYQTLGKPDDNVKFSGGTVVRVEFCDDGRTHQ